MRIALVTPFKDYAGGVESVNKVIEKIFLNSGFEVSYITLNNSTPRKIVDFFGPFLLFLKVLFSRSDLYIANGEYGIACLTKKSIVIHHGSYYGYLKNTRQYKPMLKRLKLIYKAFLQKTGSYNSFNISVSEYVREVLSEAGLKIDMVVPNTIEQKHINSHNTSRNNRILFIGNYDYYGKGIDIIEKISSTFPFDAVSGKKIKNTVNLEQMDREKLLDMYGRYSLFFLPSRFEGMSMSVIESLSAGTPILISEVGDYKRIKKICPEFVCQINDLNEVQEKIENILNNQKKYIKTALNIYTQLYSYSESEKLWKKAIENVI
ncbi:MAG: glycosyltransferase [Balneola sp.]